MEIKKDGLDKLKMMSEEQLKKVIGDIADALGAGPQQKKRMMNNSGFLKKKLEGSSEKDISKLLGKLPPEKQSELLKKLKL